MQKDLSNLSDRELLDLHSYLTKKKSKFHNAQLAKKIQLNSAYGALGNVFFRYYDPRLASAITMSGQLAIKWVALNVNEYFNRVCGTKDFDFVIASDTDSIYLDFGKIIDTGLIESTSDDREMVKRVIVYSNEIVQKIINDSYDNLAKRMNAFENAMVMKTEAVSNKVIWKAKKMYIANVLNSEGVDYDPPEIKMMGIETIRSSTPSAVKKALKEAISLIINTDEETVQEFIRNFRKKYRSLEFDDIAFPRGINGLTKYTELAAHSDLYKKGTPIHVKGAIFYNRILSDYKLTDRFSKIYDGDKIKFVYLKLPNPFFTPVLAAPKHMPKEFEIEKHIDWDTQFDKSFLEPLRHIMQVIPWSPEKRLTLEGFFE